MSTAVATEVTDSSVRALPPAPMRGLDRWSVEPLPSTADTTATSDTSDTSDTSGFVLIAGTTVRGDEPALRGHFPGLTIYPGVFVLETVQQALSLAVDAPVRVRALRSIRFLAPLLAGDSFTTRATVTATGETSWRARGTVGHDGTGSTAVRFDLEFVKRAPCP